MFDPGLLWSFERDSKPGPYDNFQDKLLTRTDCGEAGDYIVPYLLSPRDLVFRPYIGHKLYHHRKRKLIFLLSITRNYVVPVRRGFLFLLVVKIGCVILLWLSLGIHFTYFW